MLLDLIGPFIFGLAGSGHCLGMCGPLVLAYSLHLRLRPSRGPHSCVARERRPPCGLSRRPPVRLRRARRRCRRHRGGQRISSPISRLQGHRSPRGGRPHGPVRDRSFWRDALAASRHSGRKRTVGLSVFRRLFSSKRPAAKFLLGLAVGCLPCMLSLSMMVKAATTGRSFLGFLTMLCFGLGALPALFFTGLSASLLSFRARLLGERMAAAMAIVMGFILIFKAFRACGWV